MTAARRFKPIFTATVVPQTVEILDGAKGPYTLMRGAVIVRDGKPDLVRTVMAFGTPHSRVSGLLQEGRPIDLAVRFSGPTMTVVGLPKNADPAIASVRELGLGREDLAIRALYGILLTHGYDRDFSIPVIERILGGEAERIEGEAEELEIDPDLLEELGHVLVPLIDAGVDHDQAVEIARQAVSSSDILSQHLADVRQMLEQETARALLG